MPLNTGTQALVMIAASVHGPLTQGNTQKNHNHLVSQWSFETWH